VGDFLGAGCASRVEYIGQAVVLVNRDIVRQ
jgi:hypothetical protein